MPISLHLRRRFSRGTILLAAIPASVGALAVAANCSDGTPNQQAGAADAAPDGTFEASHSVVDASEAAVDAGETDGPFSVGRWELISGTPAHCSEIRISQDPSLLASRWVACASKRTGCRVLDTWWTKNEGLTVDAERHTDPVRLIGDKAYFLWRRTFPPAAISAKPFVAYVDVVEPLDGAPVFAIGQRFRYDAKDIPYQCFTDAIFGDYGVGFTMSFYNHDNPAAAFDDWMFGWAPWATPSKLTTRTLTVSALGLPHGAYFVEKTLGAKGMWLQTREPSTVTHFDFTTEKALQAQANLLSEMPSAVSGGATIFDARSPYAIASMKEDGSIERLVTPTAPQFVTAKALDRSMGPTLLWVESDPGTTGFYSNSTLWSAPLAANEAGIVRKKIAKLVDVKERGGAYGVANKGVFLSLIDANKALLTRLSDGMGWTIEAEPGDGFTQPVWVDDSDAFLESATLAPNGDPDPGRRHTVLRFARSALGAPSVPSGL